MTVTTVGVLLLIAFLAVLAPLIADRTGPLRVPAVVIELLLGVLVGPHVLGWAHPDALVTGFSSIGLTFLMFLAGEEIDLDRIKGRPLRLAAVGWGLSLAIALLVGLTLVLTGLAIDRIVIGLALTTTALGTLLPILGDSGALQGDFGARMLAIGTIGEFAPIVAVAIVLDDRNPVATAAILALFLATAVGAVAIASRAHRSRLMTVMHRHLHSSSQLPIRVCVLLTLALVYLAYRLGLDVLLGAFAAGMAVRVFADGADKEMVHQKLTAIGYGFFIPIFFIVSGMSFAVHDLVDQPSTLLRVPFFLALLLVVRGLPTVVLNRRDLSRARLAALGLFSSTGLPLIVVITTIGLQEGRMRPANAAALVGAGILSVLIYPLVGLSFLRRGTPQAADHRRADTPR